MEPIIFEGEYCGKGDDGHSPACPYDIFIANYCILGKPVDGKYQEGETERECAKTIHGNTYSFRLKRTEICLRAQPKEIGKSMIVFHGDKMHEIETPKYDICTQAMIDRDMRQEGNFGSKKTKPEGGLWERVKSWIRKKRR